MSEHHASKLKGLAWLAAACMAGVLLAAGFSPLVRAIPWSWETTLANVVSFVPPISCESTPQARSLLAQLVKRIYPVQPDDRDFSIDVHVVDNAQVNAYAELGGNITIYSGLLKQAESAEELAGVLAHEMEHVHRRHILEGFFVRMLTAQGIGMIFSGGDTDWTKYFLNMDFTRTQEAEADKGGLKRLQAAHVDNQGFKHFFERMEESSLAATFLSDHPSNEARIAMVAEFDNHDTRSVMTPEEWKILKNYCSR